MPRRDHQEKAFRVRVKKGDSFRSSRLFRRNHRSAASGVREGRIISVTKISPEEIGRFGEFFQLGPALMKEFREDRRRKNVELNQSRTELESREI